MSDGFDTEDGRELYLFANNDGRLYERSIRPAYRRLTELCKAGTYSRAKAIQLFKTVMSHAVDMYRREVGPRTFTTTGKTEAAEAFVNYFEAEFKLGNMPH